MSPTDTSSTTASVPPPALLRLMKLMVVAGLTSFTLMWLGFGLFAFFMIHNWGIEYDRKIEMIKRREVKPITLNITGLSEKKRNGGWDVVIGKGGKPVAWRSGNNVTGVHVGDAVTAYQFGDKYLIPRFDRGGHHWGKWGFLGFGFLPLTILGGVLLFRWLRRRE